jgi:catechol 2,3-dioxygenase-like lactoylglutathione lyase family enzyme
MSEHDVSGAGRPSRPWSRRKVLAGGAGVAAAAWLGAGDHARGQNPPRAAGSEPDAAAVAAALPLATLGLEHIGIVVPDVTRAARFYSRVFNPELYKERDGPLRYYVTLDPGYIALGSRAGTTGAFIDHDCALLKAYDRAAMARRLEAEGLPAGRFGIIPDPDGLGLQLLGVPGGLAGSTERAGRLVDGAALVRPRGLAHVVLHVSDLEKSAAFYRKFFGAETREADGSLAFHAAHTRWILQPAPRGEAPRIDRFAVNAARFDAAPLARALEALGARVVSSSAQRVHFRGPDGLGVELLPVDPARIWGLA